MHFMMKALAPMLGNFEGHGQGGDGSELDCIFHGDEILPDVCYGFRFTVKDGDSKNNVSNAYIVMSQDESGEVAMSYIDGKDRMKEVHAISTGEAGSKSQSRKYQFEGIRAAGGIYRIIFEVDSAEHFKFSLEASNSRAPELKELWAVNLKRKMTPVSLLKAA